MDYGQIRTAWKMDRKCVNGESLSYWVEELLQKIEDNKVHSKQLTGYLDSCLQWGVLNQNGSRALPQVGQEIME